MEEKLKQNKAITLIALVITIIVLIILVGVVITALTGENGLLKRASDAGKENVIAGISDEIKLAWNAIYIDAKVKGWNNEQKRTAFETELKNQAGADAENVQVTLADSNFKVQYKGYETTINGTTGEMSDIKPITDNADGIDWASIMATATKPSSQTKSNDIGLNANGEVINLDLWDYHSGSNGIILESPTIEEGSENEKFDAYAPCYLPYRPDSTIVGAELNDIVCPQYIKLEGQSSFTPVVEINYLVGLTFIGCYDCPRMLETLVLPDTLTTFPSLAGCGALTSVNIPSLIQDIDPDNFMNCDNLREFYAYSRCVINGENLTGVLIDKSVYFETEDLSDTFYTGVLRKSWSMGSKIRCLYSDEVL